MKDKLMEYFSLYELGQTHNLYLSENNKINWTLFDNVATVAYALEEYKFLDKFVKKYKENIPDEKIRANCVKLAECYLLFGKKRYSETLALIPTIENINKVFTLRKYFLEFKSFYEKNRDKSYVFEYLKDKEKNFKDLVRRHGKEGQITETEKQGHLNFFKLLCILTDPLTKNSKEDLILLLNKFSPVISEKKWLKKIISGTK